MPRREENKPCSLGSLIQSSLPVLCRSRDWGMEKLKRAVSAGSRAEKRTSLRTEQQQLPEPGLLHLHAESERGWRLPSPSGLTCASCCFPQWAGKDPRCPCRARGHGLARAGSVCPSKVSCKRHPPCNHSPQPFVLKGHPLLGCPVTAPTAPNPFPWRDTHFWGCSVTVPRAPNPLY